MELQEAYEQCTCKVGEKGGMGLVFKDGREQLELQEAYGQCTCKVGEEGGRG